MAINRKDELIKKLKKYSAQEVVITHHAKTQAYFRQVPEEEVIRNVLNPEKLVFAEQQAALRPDEEKYACYFAYSNRQAHKYVIVINKKAIIVTIIKINRKWQARFEKHAKV